MSKRMLVKKNIESCDWVKERVCIKKEENLSIVKRRERRSAQAHRWTIEKGIY